MTLGVVVYGQENCAQCKGTVRALKRAGVEYRYVDMTHDDAARALVVGWGFTAAPVVDVGGGLDRWSGYRPDRIAGLSGLRRTG